jgi:hypothetical protein
VLASALPAQIPGMAATAQEHATITVMAAITTMVAITAVRLTGTAVVSTTAAETTNRSTGTATRCTRAPRGMVTDGGSGSARYGFRCNRHTTGGSPALVARPLLVLGVVHGRVMAAGRVSPKVPTTTRDLDGGYSLIKPKAFALSYALAPVLPKHAPEVRCATDSHSTNSP